jgi:hypothetical protein
MRGWLMGIGGWGLGIVVARWGSRKMIYATASLMQLVTDYDARTQYSTRTTSHESTDFFSNMRYVEPFAFCAHNTQRLS